MEKVVLRCLGWWRFFLSKFHVFCSFGQFCLGFILVGAPKVSMECGLGWFWYGQFGGRFPKLHLIGSGRLRNRWVGHEIQMSEVKPKRPFFGPLS